MVKNHIHFIKMGGTIEFIDPAYDAINKKLMKLDASIESYLNNLIQPHFKYSSESVTQKDSREITKAEREKLARVIEATTHEHIIITHGTFTMRQTAQYLDEHLSENTKKDKKIILTGSMIPIIGFGMSDAGFNLGFTIASFMNIEAGVYICMNGGVFHAGETDKNETLLRFE